MEIEQSVLCRITPHRSGPAYEFEFDFHSGRGMLGVTRDDRMDIISAEGSVVASYVIPQTSPFTSSYIGTTFYAPWRDLYFAVDRRRGWAIAFPVDYLDLALMERNGWKSIAKKIPIENSIRSAMDGDTRWRLTNCLRTWWIDWRGSIKEQCIEYVPWGETVTPVANGFIVISPVNPEPPRPEHSGVYWLDTEGKNPTRLIEAASVNLRRQTAVSTDGCKIAVVLGRVPESEEFIPWVHGGHLAVADVCEIEINGGKQ